MLVFMDGFRRLSESSGLGRLFFVFLDVRLGVRGRGGG